MKSFVKYWIISFLSVQVSYTQVSKNILILSIPVSQNMTDIEKNKLPIYNSVGVYVNNRSNANNGAICLGGANQYLKINDLRKCQNVLSENEIHFIKIDEDTIPISKRSKYSFFKTIYCGSLKMNLTAIKVYPTYVSSTEGDNTIHVEFESPDVIGNYIQVVNITGSVICIVPITSSEMSISTCNMNGINFLHVVQKESNALISESVKIIIMP